MAKKAKQIQMRTFSFRLPVAWHDTLSQVAAERGTDVTSELNALLAEQMPLIELWLLAHQAKRAGLDEARKQIEERLAYLKWVEQTGRAERPAA